MSLGFCHSPPRIRQSQSLKHVTPIAAPNPFSELCSANYVCAGPPGFLRGLPVSKDEDFVLGLGFWFSWEGDASFGDDRAPWHCRLYGELICGIWGAYFNGLDDDGLTKVVRAYKSWTYSQDMYRICKSHLLCVVDTLLCFLF